MVLTRNSEPSTSIAIAASPNGVSLRSCPYPHWVEERTKAPNHSIRTRKTKPWFENALSRLHTICPGRIVPFNAIMDCPLVARVRAPKIRLHPPSDRSTAPVTVGILDREQQATWGFKVRDDIVEETGRCRPVHQSVIIRQAQRHHEPRLDRVIIHHGCQFARSPNQ